MEIHKWFLVSFIYLNIILDLVYLPGLSPQDIHWLNFRVHQTRSDLVDRIQKLENSVSWLLRSVPMKFQPVSPGDVQRYPLQASSSESANNPLIDLTNISPTATPMSQEKSRSPTKVNVKSSLLKTLAALKEKKPLPEIDKSTLISPQEVVDKYPQFLNRSKMSTLAVKLSKESYFGNEIMVLCTVKGTGKFHALPESVMKEFKLFLLELSVPRCVPTRLEFEVVWKDCLESIGQACKNLRKT